MDFKIHNFKKMKDNEKNDPSKTLLKGTNAQRLSTFEQLLIGQKNSRPIETEGEGRKVVFEVSNGNDANPYMLEGPSK